MENVIFFKERFKKNVWFVAFSNKELFTPNQLSEADYISLQSSRILAISSSYPNQLNQTWP